MLRFSIVTAFAMFWFACDPVVDSSYHGEALLQLKGTVSSQRASISSVEIQVSLVMFGLPPESDDDLIDSGDNEFGVHVISAEVAGTFPAKFKLEAFTLPGDGYGARLALDDYMREELRSLFRINAPDGANHITIYNGIILAHQSDYDIEECFDFAFGYAWSMVSSSSQDYSEEDIAVLRETCSDESMQKNILGGVREHALWFLKFDSEEQVYIRDAGPITKAAQARYNEQKETYERCLKETLEEILSKRSRNFEQAIREGLEDVEWYEVEGFSLTETEMHIYENTCSYPSDDDLEASRFNTPDKINYRLDIDDDPLDVWLYKLLEMTQLI